MKKLLLLFVVIASIASASTQYPPLATYSFDGVIQYAMPKIASGTSLPPIASATPGDFFWNIATPTIPVLYRMDNTTDGWYPIGVSTDTLNAYWAPEIALRNAADANIAATAMPITGSSSVQWSVATPTTDSHLINLAYAQGHAPYSLSTYTVPNWTKSDWTAENASSSLFLTAMMNYPSPNPKMFVKNKPYTNPSDANSTISPVVLPNGQVCLVPYKSDAVMLYNIYSGAITAGATASTTNGLWSTGNHVLFQDKVIFTPSKGGAMGIYNWQNNTFAFGAVASSSAPAGQIWNGSVLMPNNKILLIPNTRTNPNIGIYDPIANTFSNVVHNATPTYSPWGQGIVAPNNKVYLIPVTDVAKNSWTSQISAYDIANGTVSSVGSTGYNRRYGVLMANGKILLNSIFSGSSAFFILDPSNNTITATGITRPTTNYYYSVMAQLLPDGRVALLPGNGTTIDIYDPVSNTIAIGAVMSVNASDANTYANCVLLPDGNLLVCPAAVTSAVAPMVIYTGFGTINPLLPISPWVNNCSSTIP